MNDGGSDAARMISHDEDMIEGSRGLVLRLCHEVDPAVAVTLTPYHWHGEAVLDIGLHLHGHSHHLQVSADRLGIVWDDHEILKHDIEEAVHDLHRHGHPGEVSEAGTDVDHTMPDAVSAFEGARDPALSPAAVASGSPHGTAMPAPVGTGELGTPERPVAPLLTRDTPDTGLLPRRAPTDPLDPADRAVLDRTIHLMDHLLAEIEPAAAATYEEYHWHGELTLDVAVTLHGHVHHYEVTSDRCRLFLDDHEMLHHDLEGVIEELHREAAGAEHHEPAHQSAPPTGAAQGV